MPTPPESPRTNPPPSPPVPRQSVGNRRNTHLPALPDIDQGVVNPPNRAEQPDKRRGRADGGKRGHPVIKPAHNLRHTVADLNDQILVQRQSLRQFGRFVSAVVAVRLQCLLRQFGQRRIDGAHFFDRVVQRQSIAHMPFDGGIPCAPDTA